MAVLTLCSSTSRLMSSAATRSVSSSSHRTLTRGQLGFAIPSPFQSVLKTSLRMSTMKDDISTTEASDQSSSSDEGNTYTPPWSIPSNKPNSKAFARFRQHVNPLSRRYQMRTELPDDWPKCDFKNIHLPLYLDIGCGKGGFLLELVGRRHGNGVEGLSPGEDAYRAISRSMEDSTSQWLPDNMNYLGLEIRPGVSQYAQARVEKRGLDGKLSFVGCNANVDLDRLLTLYQDAAGSGVDQRLAFVSIQFPDPHFKKAHEKRRVVTPELVKTLAKFMKKGDAVFLQSDIKDALEAMREKFADEDGRLYFSEIECGQDGDAGEEDYNMKNPLGVPTEREVSVLSKDLPVYRTLFKRNDVDFN
jgi:tRNA (guanine-N7-)-methyltransferase